MPLLPIISDCEIQDNRLAMVLADDDSVSALNYVCPYLFIYTLSIFLSIICY